MPPCKLNDRQKALLNSIVPGIKDGKIGLSWAVSTSGNLIAIFDDVHDYDVNFHELGWSKAQQTDFIKFVECGFFHDRGSGHYVLDDTAIFDGYDRNWEIPVEVQPSPTIVNIHHNTFSGITNISSIIKNSTQYIQESDALTDQDKDTVNGLLAQLDDALNDVSVRHEKQAKTVANQARRLAEDLADPDVDEGQKQITLDGLKKAAENLAGVTPKVLPIVAAIIEFAGQIHRP